MSKPIQPRELPSAWPSCAASLASARVPRLPGYYAIHLHELVAFPEPFRGELSTQGTQLIYIGIATVSLYERLVEQDLWHKKASSFFRCIASILGYRPPPGSLAGKANQNNYRFSASETSDIVRWIEKSLLVSWSEASPALAIEKELIRTHRPLLNTTHNPSRSAALSELRLVCRTVARSR